MRRITRDIQEEIKAVYRSFADSGMPKEAIVEKCAAHAIGLLQIADECDEWFEKEVTDVGKEGSTA